jgi:hypothetical protein
MASEFAIGLSRTLTHGVPEDILEWGQAVIDKELQEVREVLDSTSKRRLPDGPCWCKSYLSTLGHTEDCQRARALMERLNVR